MPRVRDGLFDDVASFEALAAAALRAVAGKRRTPVPAAFLANLETEVLRLERELRAGRWRPGRYVEIEVTDPKRRLVSAAPFRDRVVHHAVHAVVAPLFERGFIDHSYANRTGKGTHRAVRQYERFRDRHRYVLRGDVYRYFPAIDHAILKADLRRRIACRRTLAVLDRIIDGSNPQEPVHHYYPGDDLFTPYERRRGLPIGNLTSQLFANVYLDRFDHFVTEVLRAPYRPAPCRRVLRSSSGTCCCRAVGGGCRRRTCGGSGTGCAGCGTGGAPWRFLEQQPEEPPLGESQQERCGEPEHEQRFSRGEHAPRPEPAGSWPRRARAGASRAAHDEPGPPVLRGGSTAGARPGPPEGDGRRLPFWVDGPALHMRRDDGPRGGRCDGR